jgi:hypothetical protein
VAKQAAVALAAAGFLAVLLLARASHAGTSGASGATSKTSSSTRSSSTNSPTQSSDEFDYGSPSVAPSTATPQAQTSVS